MSISARYAYLLRACFAGLLVPLGFAPFHFPGLAILGMTLFFAELRSKSISQSFWVGLIFGLSYLGFGVSWIYVSIHVYGHLFSPLAMLITLIFVFYLALYPTLVAVVYILLASRMSVVLSCLLFCALWCLGEYLRATLFTGFPWLLLGFGQVDTPLKYMLPVVGIYGAGFLTCLAATCLASGLQSQNIKRYVWMGAFIFILLAPSVLKHKQWATQSKVPLSVGIIQANLSMRDKWDESLFWQLLQRYKAGINTFMGKKDLIVLPESAFPLPASYISDFLETLNIEAKRVKSSILLGIPQATDPEESHFYNSLMTLGSAEGYYFKQHLVPFGEFIPKQFDKLVHWLSVPTSTLEPGKNNQPLILVHNHPIATLICYELAYPQLLRQQLPKAEWIVSVSDDGWFGHSLAMFQQLQIAQALSLQTGRFQVVANNDGLSSVIDTQGNIVASLPAFTSSLLEASIYPATGFSPWVYFGDKPILFFCILIVLLAPIAANQKRRYPYQPN